MIYFIFSFMIFIIILFYKFDILFSIIRILKIDMGVCIGACAKPELKPNMEIQCK